jgi:hypothetical protein
LESTPGAKQQDERRRPSGAFADHVLCSCDECVDFLARRSGVARAPFHLTPTRADKPAYVRLLRNALHQQLWGLSRRDYLPLIQAIR